MGHVFLCALKGAANLRGAALVSSGHSVAPLESDIRTQTKKTNTHIKHTSIKERIQFKKRN